MTPCLSCLSCPCSLLCLLSPAVSISSFSAAPSAVSRCSIGAWPNCAAACAAVTPWQTWNFKTSRHKRRLSLQALQASCRLILDIRCLHSCLHKITQGNNTFKTCQEKWCRTTAHSRHPACPSHLRQLCGRSSSVRYIPIYASSNMV